MTKYGVWGSVLEPIAGVGWGGRILPKKLCLRTLPGLSTRGRKTINTQRTHIINTLIDAPTERLASLFSLSLRQYLTSPIFQLKILRLRKREATGQVSLAVVGRAGRDAQGAQNMGAFAGCG